MPKNTKQNAPKGTVKLAVENIEKNIKKTKEKHHKHKEEPILQVDENDVQPPTAEQKKKINSTAIKEQAGIIFSVTKIKKWAKEYIVNEFVNKVVPKQKDLDKPKQHKKKGEEANEVNDEPKIFVPGFSYSHYALCGIIERIIELLIIGTKSSAVVDAMGLYTINRKMIQHHILVTKDLRESFLIDMDKYDQTIHYMDQLPIERKKIYEFLDKKFGENINLTPKALEFVCYIVLRSMTYIMNLCFHNLMKMNNKGEMKVKYKTISWDKVVLACYGKFSESLINQFKQRVEDIVMIAHGEGTEKEAEKTEKNNDDDDGSNDEDVEENEKVEIPEDDDEDEETED